VTPTVAEFLADHARQKALPPPILDLEPVKDVDPTPTCRSLTRSRTPSCFSLGSGTLRVGLHGERSSRRCSRSPCHPPNWKPTPHAPAALPRRPYRRAKRG
jgi:hypothetical protein